MIPAWLQLARDKIGQHEVAGRAANPFVLECFSHTSLAGSPLALSDETPWCSAFLCWCMEQSGIPSTRSAAAASWRNWGLQVARPYLLGAVILLEHTPGPDAATGSASGNHVGLYEAMDATHIKLLGGNQSDSVKLSAFPLAQYRVVTARWPLGVPMP